MDNSRSIVFEHFDLNVVLENTLRSELDYRDIDPSDEVSLFCIRKRLLQAYYSEIMRLTVNGASSAPNKGEYLA